MYDEDGAPTNTFKTIFELFMSLVALVLVLGFFSWLINVDNNYKAKRNTESGTESEQSLKAASSFTADVSKRLELVKAVPDDNNSTRVNATYKFWNKNRTDFVLVGAFCTPQGCSISKGRP